MVKEIRIYFEGDKALRPAYREFLKEVREKAEQRKIGFQVIAGEGSVVRDFMKALRTHPDAFNLLLLDAEGPDDGALRSVLEKRSDWAPPKGVTVGENQIHFMVQLMEAWFLVEPEKLAAFYGQGFNVKKLPANKKVEQVPKDDVLQGLKEATEKTQKEKYHKTWHAPIILSQVDAAKVRKASPHCARLFQDLLAVIA